MQYQDTFQEAKYAFDRLQTFNIDVAVAALDQALSTYSQTPTSDTLSSLQSAFAPIGTYYSQLADINSNLQSFLDKASKDLVKLNTSEERYSERIHPEESVVSREIIFGVFPTFRVEALPYMIAISVFMASLTIFMIFQMGGVSGQLNLPPALVTWWTTPSVGPPFYRNPMVLGGLILVLIVAVTVFAVLYFNKRSVPILQS